MPQVGRKRPAQNKAEYSAYCCVPAGAPTARRIANEQRPITNDDRLVRTHCAAYLIHIALLAAATIGS